MAVALSYSWLSLSLCLPHFLFDARCCLQTPLSLYHICRCTVYILTPTYIYVACKRTERARWLFSSTNPRHSSFTGLHSPENLYMKNKTKQKNNADQRDTRRTLFALFVLSNWRFQQSAMRQRPERIEQILSGIRCIFWGCLRKIERHNITSDTHTHKHTLSTATNNSRFFIRWHWRCVLCVIPSQFVIVAVVVLIYSVLLSIFHSIGVFRLFCLFVCWPADWWAFVCETFRILYVAYYCSWLVTSTSST